MTTEEFSNTFDTLLNSYSSSNNFGEDVSSRDLVLDEYEKSVFLTEAQEQIVIELYSGRNTIGGAFETTEELRSYLRNLIKTSDLIEQHNTGSDIKVQLFKLPPDLLFIIYEEAVIQDDEAGCYNGNTVTVVPVTWDSFHRTKNNPFRGPNSRRVLRLDTGSTDIEAYSQYHIGKYTIKYLAKPTPIVLADLGGVSIDGFSTPTECELDPAIHMQVLRRAMELAIKSKGYSK